MKRILAAAAAALISVAALAQQSILIKGVLSQVSVFFLHL